MRKWAMAVLSLEGNSGQPEPYKQSLRGLVTNYQNRISSQFPLAVIKAGLSGIFTSPNL